MNKPILTAATLGAGLDLVMYTSLKTVAVYCVDGIEYSSKLKLLRNDDGLHVICPTCDCPVRQLHKHETRPGLCCVDCLSRAEHKAAAADERKASRHVNKK